MEDGGVGVSLAGLKQQHYQDGEWLIFVLVQVGLTGVSLSILLCESKTAF